MSTPAHLGPYRLLERIGSGGMAEVFAARRHGASGFEKDVALKVLLPELRDDAELQRLLIAEAKLGAAMAHPNLVTVFDLGVDEGRYYVAMERVRGGDLARLGAGAPMPEPLALYVAIELVDALGYLHAFADDDGRALGLVHRDISPANVLVSRDGAVKLADFGIAKATQLAAQTRARIVRGKFAYLSPEQLAGESPTARTDQFALGITLAELLTGRRPFDAQGPVQTMDRIRDGAPTLDGVADDLQPMLRRCLQTDPATRYEEIGALLGPLRAARRARPDTGSTELAAWVRTRMDA